MDKIYLKDIEIFRKSWSFSRGKDTWTKVHFIFRVIIRY